MVPDKQGILDKITAKLISFVSPLTTYSKETNKIRRKLIDCGHHFGEGAEDILSRFPADYFDEAEAYEPNPEIDTGKAETAFIAKHGIPITVHSKAVEIENGGSLFLCVDSNPYPHQERANTYHFGGSHLAGLFPENAWNEIGMTALSRQVMVEKIDLPSKLFSETKPFVLKMDIECAEWPIMERLLEMGLPPMMEEVFIEFHRDTTYPNASGIERAFKDLCAAKGVKCHDWY